MLQLISHILIITAICFIWGIPGFLYLHNNKNENGIWSRTTISRLTFLFFSGILSLSMVSAWIALWFPLNFTTLLLLTAGLSLLLFFIKKKEIKNVFNSFGKFSSISLLETLLIILIPITFVILGTIKIVNNDTGIYHIQIILWTNEYGSVPGIANLFPRYGLGSNWFNLISSFRIPLFKHENFTYLNTTLAIWFFLWLFANWRWHLRNFHTNLSNKIFSLFYLLILIFCLFDWELFRDAANSTNYDFIVTALTVMIISWLIESILSNEFNKPSSLLFTILCISLIPFKLSGIFILSPLLFFLIYNNNLRNWIQLICVALILITPLLIKNYIITGFPLYPLTWSISSPDWQVPAGMADYLKNYIYVLNRFYNSNNLDLTSIPELLNKSWISSWFSGILFQHKIIFIVSFSSLTLFFFKNKLQIDHKKLKVLFAFLFFMSIGWFFSAPSPRFGYGVLMILAFFPLCFFAGNLFTPLMQRSITILIIAASVFYIYKKINPIIEIKNYLFYPVALEKPGHKTLTINGTDFNLPEKIKDEWMKKCADIEFPCILQENKYLEARGIFLKDGFRMKQQPDSNFIRNYIY